MSLLNGFNRFDWIYALCLVFAGIGACTCIYFNRSPMLQTAHAYSAAYVQVKADGIAMAVKRDTWRRTEGWRVLDSTEIGH